MRQLIAALLSVTLVATLSTGSRAQQAPAERTATPAAAKKERERKAQAAFVAGRYDEAARALTALYADFHEAVYLRNLGRSYQKLKDPERAIASFEEYLRQASDLAPAEREQVRGFIREMEELKRQRAATAPPPPVVASAPVAAAPLAPVPATPLPAPLPAPPPALLPPPSTPALIATSPPPPDSGHASNRHGTARTIGFASLGAAALLAGGGAIFLASSWSEYNRGKNQQGCPGFYGCDKIADRVAARALWGKVLFGAAAVTAVVGGTVLYLSFSGGRNENEASIALTGKF